MNIRLDLNHIDDAMKARLEAYWEGKLPRLEKALIPYRTGIREVRLAVSHLRKEPLRSWYEVRGVMDLLSGTQLQAEDDGKDPEGALDRVVDELVLGIKRRTDLVRRDRISKRKARRADLNAAEPRLKKDAEDGRREDFLERLRLHLRFLGNQARRELRMMELQGKLHRGEVTVADVLDEVLALAWQRFADRPRDLPLDLWLTRLLDETLQRWAKQEPRPHVSLEEDAAKVSPDAVPQADEQDWWSELLGEEDHLALEDVLPDEKATVSWDHLGAEAQGDRFLSLLSHLPPAQRQAFLLSTLEDYSTTEIAMVQDRPESQVKADIEVARQTLRSLLSAEGLVEEAGELSAASAASPHKKGN